MLGEQFVLAVAERNLLMAGPFSGLVCLNQRRLLVNLRRGPGAIGHDALLHQWPPREADQGLVIEIPEGLGKSFGRTGLGERGIGARITRLALDTIGRKLLGRWVLISVAGHGGIMQSSSPSSNMDSINQASCDSCRPRGCFPQKRTCLIKKHNSRSFLNFPS